MVEIVKALTLKARVMIMDEPSSIVTDRELDELFHLIEKLKNEGLSIIYISHRLEEIFRSCNRVTVMRDGQTIATHEIGSVSLGDLVKEMVGRDVAQIFPPRRPAEDEIVLQVKNLTRPPRLRKVSLYVRRGEIVGLSGLVGAGRSDLARAIFGADPVRGGEIRFKGEAMERHSPCDAIRRGMGLLTEDRKAQGLLLKLVER